MLNTGLDEAQAGIKTEGRNINTFKYADDTTVWEKVKRLLKSVKEESEKAGLKLHIQKPKDPVPSVHGKYKRKKWKLTDFIFLGSKITADGDTTVMKLKNTCSLERKK